MTSAYERLGGAEGIRRLVEVFYDIVETHPEGRPLVALHNQGNGFSHAREAQFAFLSGFLGGPQLYSEQHRHSNVKRVHAHMTIGQAERDSWVNCMAMALDTLDVEADFKAWLMTHFRRVSDGLMSRSPAASH